MSSILRLYSTFQGQLFFTETSIVTAAQEKKIAYQTFALCQIFELVENNAHTFHNKLQHLQIYI
jgi:hypothetical protein